MSGYSNFANENLPVDTNLTNTHTHERVLSEKMIYYLQGAAPWIRFVGIAGFVFLGLTLISLLVLTANSDSIDSYSMGMDFDTGPLLIITTLPALAVGFFCSFFTYRFGNKIKAYCKTKDPAELENAFKNNKALWTLSGVLFIISLAIVALAILIGIIAGAIAGSW